MTNNFISTLIRFALRTVIGLVLTVVIGLGLYLVFAYHFTYSKGESVGFVQKLSYKGWICKTWEGEQIRALATLPAIPEKFAFTVRDDAVADQINKQIGQKVVVEYEQHKGLPGCFGETEYFITKVTPAPGE
ncbi:hypothetical protein [Limnohabitans sp. TEGF004]|mgnify:FL=1|jgi:hypothetical protein|uniref:hypothetical protein n=1 Tax=Limnohabitans sp. TEGF004 TaxID=2986281 RepID=UPI0023776215|nr:hypothetical protein [Limnohabitans sp. TEGF004]BDU56708.1 6-phosphogluconate dehydrogenase [Limnohabitans sp. TEGF004]